MQPADHRPLDDAVASWQIAVRRRCRRAPKKNSGAELNAQDNLSARTRDSHKVCSIHAPAMQVCFPMFSLGSTIRRSRVLTTASLSPARTR